MHTVLRRLALRTLLAVAVTGPAVAAQSSKDIDREAKAITHHLMSPFCPGLLLADCPSGYAQELREEVAARVAKGESASSIENDLVTRYGEQIRTEPGLTGIGWLAWLAPPTAALIGLALIVGRTRAATAAGALAAERPAPSLDGAMAERLQDELDDLD